MNPHSRYVTHHCRDYFTVKVFDIFQFSFKKTRHAALSGRSLDLRFEMVKPATEKTLSDGADVAGIQSNFLASRLKRGYARQLSFHQTKGFVKPPEEPPNFDTLISNLAAFLYSFIS